MKNNRQYVLMQEAVRKKLENANPEALSATTGFTWNGSSFETQSLGILLEIRFPDCSITPTLDLWHDLTILQYLANAKGCHPTGCFLSLSGFHSGGMARGSSFDYENDRIIRRIGQYPVSAIQSAAAALGGLPLSEKSDLTFLFYFLPRVPVKLSLWLADEDFPAAGKVLFDSSAETDLQIEAAGTVSGILLSLIEKKLQDSQG